MKETSSDTEILREAKPCQIPGNGMVTGQKCWSIGGEASVSLKFRVVGRSGMMKSIMWRGSHGGRRAGTRRRGRLECCREGQCGLL